MSHVVEKPRAYFRSLLERQRREPILLELENEAAQHSIPIIGPVVGELLTILVIATNAKLIVELGTATGYSGIYLARGCEITGGHIHSVEWDESLAARAEKSFAAAKVSDKITLHRCSAGDFLGSLKESVDMVLLDIDKEGYHHVLPALSEVIRPGGLLIADNTAFKDAREFNRLLTDSNDWRAVHLWAFLPGHSPEEDAISIAVRG